MAELTIEPNPKKMRSASILVAPAAHTKQLVGTATASFWRLWVKSLLFFTAIATLRLETPISRYESPSSSVFDGFSLVRATSVMPMVSAHSPFSS